MIIYDDFANGRCGLLFLERLVEQFGRTFRFIPRFLKLEDVAWSPGTEPVGQQVRETDVIVIAAYEETALPPRINGWLDAWRQRQKSRGGALIVLGSRFGGLRSVCRSLRSHLRRLARREREPLAAASAPRVIP